MLESWFLDQIKEEMFEASDKDTIKVITDHRQWKSIPESYDDVMEEYESI